MTYTATQDFTGVIAGVEVPFVAGQTITAKDAKEMGLANKPDIAKPTKGAAVETENP